MKPQSLALLVFATALACPAAYAIDTQAKSYETPKGELTVTYGQPDMQHAGPPPDFTALDRDNNGTVDMEEAHAGYYMLFNDFIHADLNRDKRISSREYASWLREPVR